MRKYKMKEITIGRMGCDIIIPDGCISRKHAVISLVNGQYVYQDMSKNGTTINGLVYKNQKVVVSPGTPIFLSNKVQLPWAQVLMMLPNKGVRVDSGNGDGATFVNYGGGGQVINPNSYPSQNNEAIGIGWGIGCFLFPILGFIMYFVWKDTANRKAKQAANVAWISFVINFVLALLMA